MKRCDHCALKRAVMFYPTMTKKLCTNCFVAERQLIKSLVRSMPEVENKPAPLGHRFYWNDCVVEEEKAKAWVNHKFQLFRSGALH